MEREEFGEEEGMESGNMQGILGDSIPIEAVDPSKDPNILVGEVYIVYFCL